MEAAILRCSEPVRLRWEENRFRLITNWFALEELAVGKFPAGEGYRARLINPYRLGSFKNWKSHYRIFRLLIPFDSSQRRTFDVINLVSGLWELFLSWIIALSPWSIHTHTRAAITLNFALLLASFRAKNHRFMCGSWGLTRESDVKIMILLVYCVRKFARLGGSNEISTKSPFSQSTSEALLKFTTVYRPSARSIQSGIVLELMFVNENRWCEM